MPSNFQPMRKAEPIADPNQRKPGSTRREVTIKGWARVPCRGISFVVFESQDDDGKKWLIGFPLGEAEHGSGPLHEFVTMVSTRKLVAPPGMTPDFALNLLLNTCVGRRVALIAVERSPGKQMTVGWEAVPPSNHNDPNDVADLGAAQATPISFP